MKTIFKQYFPALLALAALVILVSGIWFKGYLSEKSFDNEIDNLQTNSQNATTEAANHKEAAANSYIERSIEDGVREKVIAPKIETARRRSENSKI